jgi:ribose transport system substrate-binding protein
MNKGKKMILSSLALCTVSMSVLMTTSCGKPGGGSTKGKIAVITKNKSVSFWDDVKKGSEAAGDELGYDIIYTAASGDNDFASQVEAINDAIKEDVDAIIIAPNGNAELDEAFKKADDAGIKIININSRTDYPNVISCISSSDIDGGSVAARYAADGVLLSNTVRAVMDRGDAQLTDVARLGRGAVAIIGHTAATADKRIQGFKESTASEVQRQMAADGVDLSKMDLTQEQISDMFSKFFIEGERCSSIDAAYEEAMKILSARDCNVICFYATNTNTTLGVCRAVEELDMADKVFVIGFNSDQKELDYLKTGVLDGTIIQNPYNMGYVGVRFAKKAINDDSLPKTLDTGVTYVNADNLNDTYVQLLLHPENY